jgi:hypothetical protein
MSCYAADRWGDARLPPSANRLVTRAVEDDFALAFSHPRGSIMYGAW